jgi:2-polyprenyl-6-methoxyphenol hydroxylase-like FAD-dependent oxidoreductase
MPPTKHAIVIGGSVGGLFAASMLRDRGWSATIYERSSGDLAGRGAGVGITRELLDAMSRVGARVDSSIGVPVRSLVWLDADGTVRHEHPRLMLAGSWARIYRPLRAAYSDAHYRAGMTLERVEQEGDKVTAVFADGSRATGDVLVAADGSLSTVRRQVLPEAQPRLAGYVAWRGVLIEGEAPPTAREALTDRTVFSFHGPEMALTMATPALEDDAAAGARRFYFIWYRPIGSEASLRDLFTDASGHDHGLSIPPPAIRPELVQALKARAREIFAPPIAEIVERTRQPLLQAISDFGSPRLVFGRVILLGDSAFVARPHVAAGITKAALDAVCLAEVLTDAGDDIAAALTLYERRQRDFGAKLVAHARLLGNYVERNFDEGRDERCLDPRWIMSAYGAPHLVHDAEVAQHGDIGAAGRGAT